MITTGRRVYVFGCGDCGQLGLGEDMLSAKRPLVIPFFSDKRIVQVAAGGLHNLALSEDGSVYSWGCNDEKALGHSAPEWDIGKVDGLSFQSGDKIVAITCGDSISAALSSSGKVYTWGTFRDSKGVVGFSEHALVQEQPTLLDSLLPNKIIRIRAGANHLVALSSDSQIFSWGCGEQGQLGRRILERHKTKALKPLNITPRRRKRGKPSLFFDISPSSSSSSLPLPSELVSFGSVACGSYHTLILQSDGRLFSCGLNNYGQLGLADRIERLLPEELLSMKNGDSQSESIDILPLIQCAAGEHHSLGLTQDGRLVSWGRGDSGQLGRPLKEMEECFLEPTLIPFSSSSSSFTQVACGGNHCLALDSSNQLYAWGYGEMGQLGHGYERVEFEPICVDFSRIKGPSLSILQIDGGGQHSIILASV